LIPDKINCINLLLLLLLLLVMIIFSDTFFSSKKPCLCGHYRTCFVCLFASSETLNTATVKQRKKNSIEKRKKLLCDLEIISFQRELHGNMY